MTQGDNSRQGSGGKFNFGLRTQTNCCEVCLGWQIRYREWLVVTSALSSSLHLKICDVVDLIYTFNIDLPDTVINTNRPSYLLHACCNDRITKSLNFKGNKRCNKFYPVFPSPPGCNLLKSFIVNNVNVLKVN